MTREEAIKHIKAMCQMLLGADNKPISDTYYALEMAIAALSEEPCSDAISRQAAMDAIKSMLNANPSYWNKCDVIDRKYTLDEIEGLPSVQPIRPRGHWNWCGGIEPIGWYCSQCGLYVPRDREKPNYNYCPVCGADMREETNHE